MSVDSTKATKDVLQDLRERVADEDGWIDAKGVMNRAADEIERLRKGLEAVVEVCENGQFGCNVKSFVEIVERAEAALKRGNVHG